MVKKLFKHEFLALMRNLLPMYLILFGISALTRFVYIFEGNSTAFNILGRSSIIAMVVGCIVCLMMTAVNIITRFYKNLFSNEGYLSFTLPVSNSQHIGVKLITAVCFVVISIVVVLLSVCIATAGELTVEIFKAAGYLLGYFSDNLDGHFVYYFIEVIILALLSIFNAVLLVYSCIALGQLSKKNRAISAVGMYFIYYFITQILGTIFLITLDSLADAKWVEDLLIWISDNQYETFHIVFIGSIVFVSLISGLYYWITHTIMKKKLNLE